MQQLGAVSIIIDDYDKAIQYYTQVLGFELLEDIDQGDKRWVKISPSGGGCGLVLAKANGPEQQAMIGRQGAGRVWLFLNTDDFWRDYHAYQQAGVTFLEAPREEAYATVVLFEDAYGNKWVLLQPKG